MGNTRLRLQTLNSTNQKNKTIAGKPSPFIVESIKEFAAGIIDREELSYRLRFGHERKKDDH